MLIKKHQLPAEHPHQPPHVETASQHGQPHLHQGYSQSSLPGVEMAHQTPLTPLPPPMPEYTEDAIESGELPDRRTNRSSLQDRRRGYRRIEDRHLISKAHEEARQIKEKAYEEGLEKGLLRVSDEMAELRAQFETLLASRTEALATLSDDIAPIAVEIAERLIKVELSCDEELVNTIVEDTLQKLDRNTKTVLIKVNPTDKGRVKAYLQQQPPTHLKAEVMVIDDVSVEAGGCVVETDSGLIDASFHTRLTILKELFGAYQPATTNSLYERMQAKLAEEADTPVSRGPGLPELESMTAHTVTTASQEASVEALTDLRQEALSQREVDWENAPGHNEGDGWHSDEYSEQDAEN